MLLRQNLEVYLFLGAEVPVQVVPQGIGSVNGSNATMGCASPLVDRGGVMVCNSESYLVDGCSPAIDTSTSNWASQLVTVMKNEPNSVIGFDHVVLTFDFDTAVLPDSIELDLFLCPEWKIGAPRMYIYAYQNSNLVLSSTTDSDSFITSYQTKNSSTCDSLSTVSISFDLSEIGYHSWHILMESFEMWVYVGEVRFLRDGIPISGKYSYIIPIALTISLS